MLYNRVCSKGEFSLRELKQFVVTYFDRDRNKLDDVVFYVNDEHSAREQFAHEYPGVMVVCVDDISVDV